LIDRAAPANALSTEETQAILDACHPLSITLDQGLKPTIMYFEQLLSA
jgi:hypothetical protein